MRNYHAILAFDGVCNLCNALVRFVLKIDPKARIAFVSLQSEKAGALFPDADEQMHTVLLRHQGEIYRESDAILKIFSVLGGGWKILTVFRVLPPAFRNRMYRWIARNRYRWFGKKESCPLPGKNVRDRFL
ncbi:MAG: thiol-disulfide oxidoreductase DCC family protein [Bacteroidales bacterium]